MDAHNVTPRTSRLLEPNGIACPAPGFHEKRTEQSGLTKQRTPGPRHQCSASHWHQTHIVL